MLIEYDKEDESEIVLGGLIKVIVFFQKKDCFIKKELDKEKFILKLILKCVVLGWKFRLKLREIK